MKAEGTYLDNELGIFSIRMNVRARKIIFRLAQDGFMATVPEKCDRESFIQTVDQLRPRLLMMLERRNSQTQLDDSWSLITNRFRVQLICSDRKDFHFLRKESVLHISCPLNTDFSRTEIRQLIISGVERFLKSDAKGFLPHRLRLLADKHRLSFHEVKINSSKTRWGSCSSQRIINLSFYLMLLPTHLIDYVLLHELVHTLEMNHSSRFWTKLDELTSGNALGLRKELKQYKTSILG